MVLLVTTGIFYLVGDKNKDKYALSINGHVIPYGSMVVAFLNILQIYVMYHLYDSTSLRMNDYENHETEFDYEANYIQLPSIFIEGRCASGNCFDELLYCLIIIYGSQINKRKHNYEESNNTNRGVNEKANSSDAFGFSLQEQYFKSHYGWQGTFDNYLEMILQFVLSLVNIIIEIQVDGFRLKDDCRRPRPRITANIDLWNQVLEVFVIIAVLTNGYVIFYTYELDSSYPST
ncbi:anoctamin [Thraustotheca clavata]|uniref:Anoctamin n=1 Tax=Thraustotheca clavata TaxID=74557 RepID=A0A1V9ZCA0_9STRA|nr:anoctamin [Thraustotheca clavata]